VQDYEIDFISLSYTRSVDDVIEARAFLDAVGLANTKIMAKRESRHNHLKPYDPPPALTVSLRRVMLWRLSMLLPPPETSLFLPLSCFTSQD
jgi:hypothetical protein